MAIVDEGLAEIEQQIGAAEVRVTRQKLAIERLRVLGRDASEAEKELAGMGMNLDILLARRQVILDGIASGQGEPPLP